MAPAYTVDPKQLPERLRKSGRLKRLFGNAGPLGLLTIGLSLVGIAGGVYLLATSLSPQVLNLPPVHEARQKAVFKAIELPPTSTEDRLMIPQIGVDVAIVTGPTAEALSRGAWHRQPQNGDPIHGGNFVLSAHRFQLGRTPQGTLAKSPFYTINKLQAGQHIWINYHGRQYIYVINRRYPVKPNQLEIEAPSATAKLTLYSCSLRGSADGREVIEAIPL